MFDFLIPIPSGDWNMLAVPLAANEGPVIAERCTRPKMPSVALFQHPASPPSYRSKGILPPHDQTY